MHDSYSKQLYNVEFNWLRNVHMHIYCSINITLISSCHGFKLYCKNSSEGAPDTFPSEVTLKNFHSIPQDKIIQLHYLVFIVPSYYLFVWNQVNALQNHFRMECVRCASGRGITV